MTVTIQFRGGKTTTFPDVIAVECSGAMFAVHYTASSEKKLITQRFPVDRINFVQEEA